MHLYKQLMKSPPRKHVFMLSCMDLRFLDDIVEFMDALNLANRYDHIVFAGASLGVVELSSPSALSKNSSTSSWKDVFFHHLEVAVNVLRREVKDIFILEHLDCGAYKHFHPQYKKVVDESKPDTEAKLHREMALKLEEEIARFSKAHYQLALKDLATATQQLQDEHLKKSEEAKLIDAIANAKWRESIWKDVTVSCFLMDLTGHVKLLE